MASDQEQPGLGAQDVIRFVARYSIYPGKDCYEVVDAEGNKVVAAFSTGREAEGSANLLNTVYREGMSRGPSQVRADDQDVKTGLQMLELVRLYLSGGLGDSNFFDYKHNTELISNLRKLCGDNDGGG